VQCWEVLGAATLPNRPLSALRLWNVGSATPSSSAPPTPGWVGGGASAMATGGLAFASASELPTRPAAPEDEDGFDRDFYSIDVRARLHSRPR
jgi:hypothetical protein